VSNPIFDSIRFMRKYILQLLWFSVPLYSITIIFQLLVIFAHKAGISNAVSLLPLANIIDLIVLPFLSGGLFILVANLSDGKSISTREIIQKVGPVWLYYVLLMMVMWVMIFMGLVLYIIPGIWLYFKLIFAQPLIIFEAKSPIEALTESFKRTSAPMSKLVSIVLPPMMIIIIIYAYMLYMMGFRIEGTKPIMPKNISTSIQIMTYFLGLAVLLFTNIVQFRLYQIYGQAQSSSNIT